jgi:hypothetical protein
VSRKFGTIVRWVIWSGVLVLLAATAVAVWVAGARWWVPVSLVVFCGIMIAAPWIKTVPIQNRTRR